MVSSEKDKMIFPPYFCPPLNYAHAVGIGKIFVGGMEGGMRNNNRLFFARLLQEKYDEVYKAMGLVFPRFHGRPITLKHIEHALCEYQKFIAISLKCEKG